MNFLLDNFGSFQDTLFLFSTLCPLFLAKNMRHQDRKQFCTFSNSNCFCHLLTSDWIFQNQKWLKSTWMTWYLMSKALNCLKTTKKSMRKIVQRTTNSWVWTDMPNNLLGFFLHQNITALGDIATLYVLFSSGSKKKRRFPGHQWKMTTSC